MKIGIIGLGLIGTSLALAFREKNLYIWGMDINESAVSYLLREGIIKKGNTDLRKLLKEIKESEVIFIAVYPSKTLEIIKELKGLLNENHILTDTASVKEKIMNYIEQDDFLRRVFVGGHPLAGKERSGYKEGSVHLFQDKIYFLTPSSEISWDKIHKIETLIELIGARPFIISPQEHDKILSYTSHLPQIISYILSITVPREYLGFTGSGYKDTTRLAKSPVDLWIDIIKENKENILEVLENFHKIFNIVYEKIKMEDWKKLEDYFEESREKRLEIEVK
ncbi:MAG: prephenate dehydrogenase [Dictyoglomaceae bacterium]|nr:prephenate dehydrogenase [Dictyoglomaceae bacterium]